MRLERWGLGTKSGVLQLRVALKFNAHKLQELIALETIE